MQEKFNNLYYFLNHPKTCYIINKNMKEQIDENLCNFHNHLIKKDESSKVDTNSVIQTIKNILPLTVEINTKENFSNFIKDYCGIILEWNNIEKNREVEYLCKYLLRFADDNLTVDEFKNYFVEISKRLSCECSITRDNFKLSEHYFNLINEE